MLHGCSFTAELLHFFFHFVPNDFAGCGKNNKVHVLVLILTDYITLMGKALHHKRQGLSQLPLTILSEINIQSGRHASNLLFVYNS